MTFFPKTQISLADGASVDAFHRLRVSDVIRQFSGMVEYIDNPLIWENAILGTANLAGYNISATDITTAGLNNVQDTITIAVKTLTGFGTAGAFLDWIERY